jgi:hypothetical protein
LHPTKKLELLIEKIVERLSNPNLIFWISLVKYLIPVQTCWDKFRHPSLDTQKKSFACVECDKKMVHYSIYSWKIWKQSQKLTIINLHCAVSALFTLPSRPAALNIQNKSWKVVDNENDLHIKAWKLFEMFEIGIRRNSFCLNPLTTTNLKFLSKTNQNQIVWKSK